MNGILSHAKLAKVAKEGERIMFKAIYMVLAIAVIAFYATASWFGWEFANAGSNSRLGMPFIYNGFHGGK